MTEDVDDPVSLNFQKVTFCNFTFDFSPSLINGYFARANGGDTGYNPQLSEIVKVLKPRTGLECCADVTVLDLGVGSAILGSGLASLRLKEMSSPSSALAAFLNKPSSLFCAAFLIEAAGLTSKAEFDGRKGCNNNWAMRDFFKYCWSESGVGNEETTRVLKDEIKHLNGVIQSSLARKSVLEARLRSLSGDDDPTVDPAANDSEAGTSKE
ncbi:hypothetical protein LIER_22830 [Lithospermum erythrorhizon]|uniref:Uncharacterized protein n=1 Tax=Lithospermum erythrorhizon TaxID=34254 RepID=A0AAV3QYA4_LITER